MTGSSGAATVPIKQRPPNIQFQATALPENAKTNNQRPPSGKPTDSRMESTKMETVASNQNAKFADKAGIAAHYKVCPRTINEWMRIGLLVFFRVKRVVRFDIAACDECLKANGYPL
jgi:hypothetical protein